LADLGSATVIIGKLRRADASASPESRCFKYRTISSQSTTSLRSSPDILLFRSFQVPCIMVSIQYACSCHTIMVGNLVVMWRDQLNLSSMLTLPSDLTHWHSPETCLFRQLRRVRHVLVDSPASLSVSPSYYCRQIDCHSPYHSPG
jgi:hypothetical protein